MWLVLVLTLLPRCQRALLIPASEGLSGTGGPVEAIGWVRYRVLVNIIA